MIDLDTLAGLKFTEDDDPLIGLRRHRREISERFETVGELTTYLKQFNSVEAALERVRAKIAEKKRNESESTAK